MNSSVRLVSLEEAADELKLFGDVRTWFLITAAVFPDFPRFFRGSSVMTDIDLAVDWLEDKGLTHFLVQSGFLPADDDDDEGDGESENPILQRGNRRR